MCILFVAANPDAKPGGYRLIVASNRDEYYARPSQDASFDLEQALIGGCDMQIGREGGMWLGVSFHQKLRMGALLNVTGETVKGKGRGFIVRDYLRSPNGGDYLEELHKNASTYSPFNLVTIEMGREDAVVSYSSNSPIDSVSYEGPQILAFGNSPLRTPLQKVTAGKELFRRIVTAHNDVTHSEKLTEELLALLKSSKRHLPDFELQKRAPEAYEHLSSIFVSIRGAGYGSRTHTLILVDHDWNVDFIESTMEQPIDPDRANWRTGCIKKSFVPSE